MTLYKEGGAISPSALSASRHRVAKGNRAAESRGLRLYDNGLDLTLHSKYIYAYVTNISHTAGETAKERVEIKADGRYWGDQLFQHAKPILSVIRGGVCLYFE